MMQTHSTRGFTLLALLIVIGILAVLSTVAVAVLNPIELLKQSRDSKRISDLTALNKALQVYDAQIRSGSFGTAQRVYVSIPDSSASCANLGLPSLPSGWQYVCATTVNHRKVDGTGWVPVNLTSIPGGNPLAVLPIDPQNTTSTGAYYTYVMGGSWEFGVAMESSAYKMGGSKDLVSKDGGNATGLYEVGSNLSLNPVDYGDASLVGYWRFDEGTGTSAGDSSENGKNGTLVNNPTWGTGKINGAISLNGTNSYVNTASFSIPSSQFTFSFWFNITQDAVSRGVSGTMIDNLILYQHPLNNQFYLGIGARLMLWTPSNNTWHHLACAVLSSGSNGGPNYQAECYGNGALLSLNQDGYLNTSSYLRVGSGSNAMLGLIDDVRIYNRALSAAEIQAIYNATK